MFCCGFTKHEIKHYIKNYYWIFNTENKPAFTHPIPDIDNEWENISTPQR